MTIARIVASLTRLRQDIEAGCDEHPIDTLDLNAGALLQDVAHVLGLSEVQVQTILGSSSYGKEMTQWPTP